MGTVIERLDAAGVRTRTAELSAILIDCVDDGASVGFLPPLSEDDANAYWGTVAEAVAEGSRILLVAGAQDARADGTVQLDLAMRPNGLHRAEVIRLLVHRRARRRGLGRTLMHAIEDEARCRNRTTLVLDTRQGDPSEVLYRSLGWQHSGTIPRYARSASGALDGSAFYYKLLEA